MVNLIDLTDAIVAKLQAIPELVALLANQDPANVYGYVDFNPDSNNSDLATYDQKPGTVQVMVTGGNLNEGDNMSAFTHLIDLLLRADINVYYFDVILAIVDGIPVPGDGLPWRFCPVMDGLLPANIKGWLRQIDTEGLDYWKILVEIPESGDNYVHASRNTRSADAAARWAIPAVGYTKLPGEHP